MDVFTATLNGNSSANANAFTILEVFSVGKISSSGAPYASIRLTLTPSHADANWTFAKMFIGHGKTASDTFDFTGDQVEVTFNGGLSGATMTTNGADVVSDTITFALDPAQPLIIAWEYGAQTSHSNRSLNPITGVTFWFKQNVLEAGTTDRTGYTSVATRLDMITKIEAFSAPTRTYMSHPFIG